VTARFPRKTDAVDVGKLFWFMFVGAVLAFPVAGPAGLLGVGLAFSYFCKNAGSLRRPRGGDDRS
jgi:hypothetical protein